MPDGFKARLILYITYLCVVIDGLLWGDLLRGGVFRGNQASLNIGNSVFLIFIPLMLLIFSLSVPIFLRRQREYIKACYAAVIPALAWPLYIFIIYAGGAGI